MLTAEEIIEHLKLEPLPIEGGLYRQSYVASEEIAASALPERYGRAKPLSTAIYYLLIDDPNSFSALHQLPTDEIWHFYQGDPVEMLLLHPDGSSETPTLGHDLAAGAQPQFVVPAGVWQAARLAAGGRFALMGTTMAPGYEDTDYRGADAGELAERYPDRTALIRSLTRG